MVEKLSAMSKHYSRALEPKLQIGSQCEIDIASVSRSFWLGSDLLAPIVMRCNTICSRLCPQNE